MKQIKWFDKENELVHGGILLDNGDIICACCGGLIPVDEQLGEVEILDIYDFWVDFSDEIIGE